jgi:hypothetical protein
MDMEDFIRERNILHFLQRLAMTGNEEERKVLLLLLGQEKAKRPPLAKPGGRQIAG